MGFIKKYTGLKLTSTSNGLASGVTPLPTANAATVYYTSAVPVKGAIAVVFTFKSTDSNAIASTLATHALVCNDQTGTAAFNGSSFLSVKGGGSAALNVVGGLKVIYVSTEGGSPNQFFNEFIAGGFLSHATLPHSNVTADAEVFYASDALAAPFDYGQGTLTVPA
jgi:hypothetical protein